MPVYCALPPTPRLRCIPLPPTTSHANGPTLHTLLAYSARPYITYDLQRSSSRAVPHPSVARLGWAYEPATHPPTQIMTLSCVLLPRPIVVVPSHRDYDYVTLKDVLSAAREAFRAAAAMESECFSGFFSAYTTVSTRHMWAGLSEEIEPGVWLLHIE